MDAAASGVVSNFPDYEKAAQYGSPGQMEVSVLETLD